MIPLTTALTIVTYFLSTASSADVSIHGVAPKDAHLYKPDSEGKWSCLNHPEIVLNFDQVNDDYCDCPDGSDEPGTNACPHGTFYCANEGHIPSYIKSSLVNDGVCDYSLCCDGSDEWNTPVECPNRCDEIHKKYEENAQLERKIYEVGVDKAEKTLRAAKRLRGKLQEELEAERQILAFVTRELEHNNAELEKAVSNGKKSDTSQLLIRKKISNGLNQLKDSIGIHYKDLSFGENNLKTLNTILKTLLDNFNENLNDAAVKLTVENYQAYLEKIGDNVVSGFQDSLKSIQDKLKGTNYHETVKSFEDITNLIKNTINENTKLEKQTSELEEILNYLIENYNPNFNDPHVKEAVKSFQDYAVNKPLSESTKDIFEIVSSETSKLTDLIKSYTSSNQNDQEINVEAPIDLIDDRLSVVERLRYTVKGWVYDFLGVQHPDVPIKKRSPVIDSERQEYESFIEELQSNRKISSDRIKVLEEDLSQDFGPDDILRPLKDISFSSQIGEYGYEVFFRGDIHQKGKNNHNVKIGSYHHHELRDVDEDKQQFTIYYENGQRCWNGPLRRGVVTVDCGSQNELVSVTEPEKCEYHLKVRAPIGCKVKKDHSG